MSLRWQCNRHVTGPVHVYTTTGVYTVALTVRVVTETGTLTRTGYITVTSGGPAAPLADFSAEPLSGSAPLTVTFTNQSLPTVGLDSFEWAFGDGAASAEESPTHVYTATGVYTVSLTVSSGEESDTATKAGYITVTGGGPAAPLPRSSSTTTSIRQGW